MTSRISRGPVCVRVLRGDSEPRGANRGWQTDESPWPLRPAFAQVFEFFCAKDGTIDVQEANYLWGLVRCVLCV